jgi:hypothetical protein
VIPRRGAAAALVALTAGATLSACSTPVSVPPAPGAADPECAAIVLALPRGLTGLEHLGTTSQATAAWGDPLDPVVLRCGVEAPGPTADECLTADDGTTSVDWVAVPQDDDDGGTRWLFTTYGRSPAVEVLVPARVSPDGVRPSTDLLLDLGPAVSRAEQTSTCL